MKMPVFVPNVLCRSFITVGALAVAISAQAGLQIPYALDADTLHLWHLDDANGLYAVDAVSNNPITLTNLGMPNPGIGPYTNTSLGNASAPGLGTCDTSTTKQHLLYGGLFPDVTQFRNPTSGAFTFEALLNLNSSFATAVMDIVAGDQPSSSVSMRGWLWRIYNGTLQWNLLGGTTDNFRTNLPTTGPDAVALNTWYHVAITYTGNTPTNGDTPNLITFYWTLLDPSRTHAEPFAQFTAAFPLDGLGTSQPALGIGGSARNITSNPGNNEGVIGSIDEVRISQVARASNEMAFVSGGVYPPSITQSPPSNNLAAYGWPLSLNALVSGSQPISFAWFQNGTNLPAQTTNTLYIPSATFANAGAYIMIASNAYGSATSTVAQVSIGAAASELFGTGFDTNNQLLDGDLVDPHYTLIRSADSYYLGPTATTHIPFGNYSPATGLSTWIGDAPSPGGASYTSPAGTYIYRTTFLLDQVDPATVTLNAVVWCNGTISSIRLNGQNTGMTLAPPGALYLCSFIYGPSNVQTVVNGTTTYQGPRLTTAGFVPGLNTLDVVETITAGASSIRVQQPFALGQALAPVEPRIVAQPTNQIVRDANLTGTGSRAEFSVVALGSPPLSYQWWADGAALSGATNRVLEFYDPTTGGQGTRYSVVVANDSGSVTSQVAVLTIVPTNQPPRAPVLNAVAFTSGATIWLSELVVLHDSDPDADLIAFYYADGMSTNGGFVSQIGTALVYAPVADYSGPDEFSYTIADSLGATTVGYVDVQNYLSPLSQTNPPGVAVSFNIGVTNLAAGYAAQWQFNGVNLVGATNSQLLIPDSQVTNSGNYVCVVTDPNGVAWPSGAATLLVQAYAPYPLLTDSAMSSSDQSGYSAAYVVDGSLSTYWVSYGLNPGEGPTVSNPQWLEFTFPRVVALSEILVYPRPNYGPSAVQLIVNGTSVPFTDGTSVYQGAMANSATPLDVVLAHPLYVTNAELYITSAYDPSNPGNSRNVQVEELVFKERSLPGTFGDWELGAFTSAQVSDPALAGPAADPDGDGVPNLQEFAVGGNALLADPTNAAMAAVMLPGDQVAVQYQVRNQLGDVSLQFEASPDLANWTNVTPVAINEVRNLGTVSINQAVFPQQPPMHYYRLRYGLSTGWGY